MTNRPATCFRFRFVLLAAFVVSALLLVPTEAIALDTEVAATDSLSVDAPSKAIAIALAYIGGRDAAAADVLLSGASARDTGAYWIVTVTRVGMTTLDPPRIIAVNKADGSARNVFVDDHGHEDGEPAHRPRRFR